MNNVALSILSTLLLAPLAALSQAGGSCRAMSGAVPPTVVELYTSEGCSSCPPADRWLSTLKGKPDVLAMSFHVTYWDNLGWPDRFASPDYTARQYAIAHQNGSAQVYTPQVVVNGQDWRSWPRLPAASAKPAPLVTLAREGDIVTATVAAASGSGRTAGKWQAYWAVLEDAHQSQVRAGENSGETLKHDHVVRLLKPVPAWAAADGAKAQITVSPGAPAFPRRVVLVVTDAQTQQPLQAVALGC